MTKYNFKTALREHVITIDNKRYSLRELDGLQKGKYMNKMGTKVDLGPDGAIQSFKDYSGLETILLEECLYDENDKLVSTEVMQRWPSSLLTDLFRLAQELSGLTEESNNELRVEAKNS